MALNSLSTEAATAPVQDRHVAHTVLASEGARGFSGFVAGDDLFDGVVVDSGEDLTQNRMGCTWH